MIQVFRYAKRNFVLSISQYTIRFLFLCVPTLEAPPLLLGRCLCVGGKYAEIMPPEMSSRFLEATVNGLQENQPACIRISAVKAIYWFCKASTTETNSTIGNIIRSHLPNIFQGLFNFASQPSTEILTLVMETLQELVTVICPVHFMLFILFTTCLSILHHFTPSFTLLIFAAG